MIKRESEYYELITSLPLLQGKLNSDFDHLSRIAFIKHIKKLKEEDFKLVITLEDFIIWEKSSMDNSSDEEFKNKTIELQKKYKNKTFLAIVEFISKRRLLLGLLRKRKSGLETAPPAEETWLVSDIRFNIEKNWDKTNFGLNSIDKNLMDFDQFIQNDEALEVENRILQLTWDFCDKISTGHYFDIDFLLIYAIRRNIVDRWKIAHTPQDIIEKFNTLATEAINGRDKEEDS